MAKVRIKPERIPRLHYQVLVGRKVVASYSTLEAAEIRKGIEEKRNMAKLEISRGLPKRYAGALLPTMRVAYAGVRGGLGVALEADGCRLYVWRDAALWQRLRRDAAGRAEIAAGLVTLGLCSSVPAISWVAF